MKPHHSRLTLTLAAIAVLGACSTLPPNNPRLEQARDDYRAAQADPQARDLAGGEMKQAADALARADDAAARREAPATVDHLAYLAKQRVAIARATGAQKAAEVAVTNAGLTRDQVRLAARTSEADAAQRSAEASQRQSAASQRAAEDSREQSIAAQGQAEESQRQARAAQRDSEAAQQQAAASQLQSAASQQQASDAQARNAQLQAQLKDLDARQTSRGIVVTIGDVLFDTDRAQLKAGSRRSVEKLVGFLKEYPRRNALVEGYTDSTGSESHNQELSSRRAESVRAALVDMGVGSSRVATRGYGQAYPVASNDSLDGRQLNRRVEVVLSDDSGVIAPR